MTKCTLGPDYQAECEIVDIILFISFNDILKKLIVKFFTSTIVLRIEAC